MSDSSVGGMVPSMVGVEERVRVCPSVDSRSCSASGFVGGYLSSVKLSTGVIKSAKIMSLLVGGPGFPAIKLETSVSTLPVSSSAGLSFGSGGSNIVRTYDRSKVITATLNITGLLCGRGSSLGYGIGFVFSPTSSIKGNTGGLVGSGILSGPGISGVVVFRCTGSSPVKVSVRGKISATALNEMKVSVVKGSSR